MNDVKNIIVSEFFNRIIQSNNINCELMNELRDSLLLILSRYKIEEQCTEIVTRTSEDEDCAKMFLISKKIEGLSDKSIVYYTGTLKKFYMQMNKRLKDLDANDIRYYLAMRKNTNISNVTLDNELRVLKSFFSWLTAENYISKSPTIGIKAIKKPKTIKKPFEEIEIESIRRACKSKRDLAIVEFLLSTGARVEEVSRMNKRDIKGDTCTVFGKGDKERYVFLNAKAQYAIDDYLKARRDENEALFVHLKSPHERLGSGGIERMIRDLGQATNIQKCHPHKCRRTMATLALNRGMPLEQVSQILGHENIETTTIYARSDIKNVKDSHRKYIV